MPGLCQHGYAVIRNGAVVRENGGIFGSCRPLIMTCNFGETLKMAEVQDFAVQVPREVSQHWGWLLALGIGLVLLGIAAVSRSMTTTVVSMVFFGWLLAMAAGIEIVQAIIVGKWAGFFLHLLAAILYGVTGFLFISRPRAGAEVITLLMAAFFMIGGLFELVGAPLAQLPAWGWNMFDGAISFVLGLLILAQWPVSGLWVVGLFVGIRIIFFGIAWIALALSLSPA